MSHPRSEDFTIATVIDDDAKIAAVATALNRIDEYTPLTGSVLRQNLSEDYTLSVTELEAVFVGLLLNDAAERVNETPSLLGDEFCIDFSRAEAVLGEQAAVRRAFDDRRESSEDRRRAVTDQSSATDRPTLLATVPTELDMEISEEIKDLDSKLRAAILSADETVRVATPYFDPGHPTVEALHGLPERGITTQVLTRRVVPGTDRYRVLESMVGPLDTDERNRLDIAELFVEDETGRQAYATHAKLVVVDERICYLGSANFTVTNLVSNFEVGILTSPADAKAAARLFDEVFWASRNVPLSRFE